MSCVSVLSVLSSKVAKVRVLVVYLLFMLFYSSDKTRHYQTKRVIFSFLSGVVRCVSGFFPLYCLNSLSMGVFRQIRQIRQKKRECIGGSE